MRTLTLLVTSDDANYDTETGVAIIVLALIGLAFWAATEFQLRRPANQEPLGDPERDAIAETIGLIDQRRSATYAGEFADTIEQQLRVIDGGAR